MITVNNQKLSCISLFDIYGCYLIVYYVLCDKDNIHATCVELMNHIIVVMTIGLSSSNYTNYNGIPILFINNLTKKTMGLILRYRIFGQRGP